MSQEYNGGWATHLLDISVWDRSGEPNRSNDTIFEGYVGMDEKEGEVNLYGRKV